MNVCGAALDGAPGTVMVMLEPSVVKRDRTRELNDVQWIGNIVRLNLRVGEAADFHVRARRSRGTEPIGIRDIGVREIQHDGLDKASVVFAVERGERHGVGAIVEQALLNREGAGEIRLAVEIQDSDR